MSEIVDLNRIFGEELPEADLLGGYEDFSGGHAVVFFADLAEEDRHIIYKIASDDINPLTLDKYARKYAIGYAIQDPERTNHEDIKRAHTEIDCARRYLEIFLRGNRFFPVLTDILRPSYDLDDRYSGLQKVTGWENLWDTPPQEAGFIQQGKDALALLSQVDRFF